MKKISSYKAKIFLFLLGGIFSSVVSGCLFVRGENEEREQRFEISPRPEIEMSEELVRSRDGDMVAFLPQDWFFVNVEKDAPVDVFAVAVNQDYTLSAVFSSLRNTERVTGGAKNDGALALARLSFEKRARKTGGAVKQIGKFATINIGPREFGSYEFSSTGGALKSRTAVFQSSLGNYYEFSLVPLTVSGKDIPPDSSAQKIFRSILTTIQY